MSTVRWASVESLQQSAHPRAAEALDAASFILWSLSGRQYTGIRRVTEMYDTSRALSAGAGGVRPVMQNGRIYNTGGSGCCCTGCGVFHRIRLRGTPVRRIIEVHVAGRSLRPDEYVILDHSTLGFLTSDACCASCIVVTYIHGYLPPGGESAAARLADELLHSLDGDDACSLPQRVTSVTRAGVSFTLLDPQDFLDKRRTGIYEIDLMLSALNPAKALMKPRVFSPDAPRAETWDQTPPPPAALLSDGDQAIICGQESVWIVHHERARHAVQAGQLLRTQIGTLIRRRAWQPVDGSNDAIALTLQPEETSVIANGTQWVLYDDSDNIIQSGEVRVL